MCGAFSSSLLSFIAALLSIEFYLSLSLSHFVCVSSATEKEWNSLSPVQCVCADMRCASAVCMQRSYAWHAPHQRMIPVCVFIITKLQKKKKKQP